MSKITVGTVELNGHKYKLRFAMSGRCDISVYIPPVRTNDRWRFSNWRNLKWDGKRYNEVLKAYNASVRS